MKKGISMILPVILCCVTVLLSAPFAVSAEETGKSCALHIVWKDEGKALSNVTFAAYLAAKLQEQGEGYELTDHFSGCGVTLNSQMTNADWMLAAGQLAEYAKENGISPDYSGKTDGNGELTFQDIPPGLYVLTGAVFTVGGKTYTPQTFCVVVPGCDADGNPVSDVTATPKFERNDAPQEGHGNLYVTKTVTGEAGDPGKEWHFRVELGDTSIDGQFGDMFFKNGVAEFTLKHGEGKTAAGLPAGTTYTVTEAEANQEGYQTSVAGGSGSIPEKDTATAGFVNSNPPDHPDEPDNPPGGPPYRLFTSQTGDDSHLEFWIPIMAVSLLVILGASFFLWKRRKK